MARPSLYKAWCGSSPSRILLTPDDLCGRWCLIPCEYSVCTPSAHRFLSNDGERNCTFSAHAVLYNLVRIKNSYAAISDVQVAKLAQGPWTGPLGLTGKADLICRLIWCSVAASLGQDFGSFSFSLPLICSAITDVSFSIWRTMQAHCFPHTVVGYGGASWCTAVLKVSGTVFCHHTLK